MLYTLVTFVFENEMKAQNKENMDGIHLHLNANPAIRYNDNDNDNKNHSYI